MNRPADFSSALYRVNPDLLYFENLETLQVNMGNLCNQRCNHCHVNAGPDGKNVMDRTTINKVIQFLETHPGLILDITGGAPELNPDFVYFIEQTDKFEIKRIVRTNLTVMAEEDMSWLPTFYRDHNLVLMASFPCYTRENLDKQRGSGAYDKSIKALKMLNASGYSKTHELNLVYNPIGASLPPAQKDLERIYRDQLLQNFNTQFNSLYTITNNPVGRFEQVLRSENGYDDYIQMLCDHFNPEAARNIMCRTLISINWQGKLFNCDFNQARDLPLRDEDRKVLWIQDLDDLISGRVEIQTGDHCYSCTAGSGSSCSGELAADEDRVHQEVNYYYGKVLKNTRDLKTSACCSIESIPDYQKQILERLEPEILEKFYGCGSPIPLCINNCTVIDLGCGTGRDVYTCAYLAGENGYVLGVDMTSEQLSVARRNMKKQMESFGYTRPNVEFLNGQIENLYDLGIEDNSADVIISNCVINLSPDKDKVFKEIFRVLKPGGELYFSDVFADRRVPDPVKNDPVLVGECLGGAMYTEDFRRLLLDVGFKDYRVMSNRKIDLNNQEIAEKTGSISFYSMTIRTFKLKGLEDACEDYGQTAEYLGTIPQSPHNFILDDHYMFITGQPVPVCGNTALMLQHTRYRKHFIISGSRDKHFGLFQWENIFTDRDILSEGDCC